jgi:hypothetical protein
MLYVVTGPLGQLLGWGTDPRELRVPPSGVVVQREQWDAPPPLPYVWSVVARDWIVPPRPPDARPEPFTPLEFASRFTEDEQIALEIAEDSGTPQVRAALRVISKNLVRAGEVRVDDPRTQRGVAISVDVLVSMGLVAPENRDARIAAALAPKDAS